MFPERKSGCRKWRFPSSKFKLFFYVDDLAHFVFTFTSSWRSRRAIIDKKIIFHRRCSQISKMGWGWVEAYQRWYDNACPGRIFVDLFILFFYLLGLQHHLLISRVSRWSCLHGYPRKRKSWAEPQNTYQGQRNQNFCRRWWDSWRIEG